MRLDPYREPLHALIWTQRLCSPFLDVLLVAKAPPNGATYIWSGTCSKSSQLLPNCFQTSANGLLKSFGLTSPLILELHPAALDPQEMASSHLILPDHCHQISSSSWILPLEAAFSSLAHQDWEGSQGHSNSFRNWCALPCFDLYPAILIREGFIESKMNCNNS